MQTSTSLTTTNLELQQGGRDSKSRMILHTPYSIDSLLGVVDQLPPISIPAEQTSPKEKET